MRVLGCIGAGSEPGRCAVKAAFPDRAARVPFGPLGAGADGGGGFLALQCDAPTGTLGVSATLCAGAMRVRGVVFGVIHCCARG